MQGTPLVSVIIPCWNAEAFVGEAIQSALDQTYPNVEVIVIDDGSTDNSLDVIKSFGEKVRWKTGPNRGACAARNRGIEIAKGGLIQFLDADDTLLPEKVDFQVQVGPPMPGCVITCDRFEKQLEDTCQREVRAQYHADPFIFFLENQQIGTPSSLIHRYDLEKIGGFRTTLTCCQEFEMHLRLGLVVEKIIHVDKPLFTVRKCPDSISSDYVKILHTKKKVLQEMAHRLEGENNLLSSRRASLAKWLAKTAHQFTKLDSFEEGAEIFEAALQLDKRASYEALSFKHGLLARLIGFPRSSRVFALARAVKESV